MSTTVISIPKRQTGTVASDSFADLTLDEQQNALEWIDSEIARLETYRQEILQGQSRKAAAKSRAGGVIQFPAAKRTV